MHDIEDAEGSLAIHWFSSYEANGKWYHEIGISGTATGTSFHNAPIDGQKYGTQPEQGLGAEIFGTYNNSDFGQYPADGEGVAPSWAQPLASQAISMLDPGDAAGWFLASGEALREMIGTEEDGLNGSYYDTGFQYRNTTSYFSSSWTESTFFHKIIFATHSDISQLRTYGGYGVSQTMFGTEFEEIEFFLTFFNDYVSGLGETKDSNTSTLSQNELLDAGIEKVPEDRNIVKKIDGKIIEPDFIATRSPVSVKDIRYNTTFEKHYVGRKNQ